MGTPKRESAIPFRWLSGMPALSFIAAIVLVTQTYAETTQRCDEITDFDAEFERVFLSDPNVVAKCEAYGTVRFADPFGPFPLGGTASFELSPYVFLADKIEIVNGNAYLRRYNIWGEGCGDIENPPSHIFLEGMTCRFR
jgi:hypothetical protein